MCSSFSSTDSHSIVHFNNTGLIDNSSSHISTTYSPTNHFNTRTGDLTPQRKTTLASFLDLFRSKRTKSANQNGLSNGFHNVRTQGQNTCSTAANQMEVCEAHLRMLPYTQCNRDHPSSDNGASSITGTQSIEKLYVSRKDNPVYSMLPQQDPSDLISNQSPHKHLPITIDTRQDEADWIRENMPLEHSMLIRSPPPIKRLDSPLHIAANARASPLRTRINGSHFDTLSHKEAENFTFQDSVTSTVCNHGDEYPGQVTRFITTAEVCQDKQDCINGNKHNTYT